MNIAGGYRHRLRLEAAARRVFSAANARDAAALRDGNEAHFRMPPAVPRNDETHGEAYQIGTTGCATFGRRITMKGIRAPTDSRFALIFPLEDGAWKALCRHTSVGIPNAETHGAEHRVLDALAASASLAESLASQADNLGSVVSRATRVTAIADPGEIRVWDTTRAMVGASPDHTFDDPVSVPFKRLGGDNVPFALEWRA